MLFKNRNKQMLLTSESKIIKRGTQNQSVSIKRDNVHTLGHLDQKVRSKFITNQLLFPLIDRPIIVAISYFRTVKNSLQSIATTVGV